MRMCVVVKVAQSFWVKISSYTNYLRLIICGFENKYNYRYYVIKLCCVGSVLYKLHDIIYYIYMLYILTVVLSFKQASYVVVRFCQIAPILSSAFGFQIKKNHFLCQREFMADPNLNSLDILSDGYAKQILRSAY